LTKIKFEKGSSMNTLIIAGTLTRDAEVKYLPNGDPIANFSVADNQGGRDKQAIFWNCGLYGKRAESLAQYLTKGQAVTVTGSVSEREWSDKEGNKRKSMDVRVNDVALQGGRKDAAPQEERRSAMAPAQVNIDEDELPF
jgi:single-strand DNA-binding protein